MSGFDLETAVTSWRRRLAERGLGRERVDELEDHLRAGIARLEAAGVPGLDAFRRCVDGMGPDVDLVAEFRKVDDAPEAGATSPSRGPSGLQVPVGGASGAAPGGPGERRPRRRAPDGSGAAASWTDGMLQDLAFGLRRMRRDRRLTLLAVVTLAFGIGATTAIFGVVRGVLLAPLPYRDADELYRIQGAPASYGPGADQMLVWAPRVPGLELAAYHPFGVDVNLTGDGREPDRVVVVEGSAPFLSLLGVTPVAGRLLVEGDGAPGTGRVAVMGHDLWRRRYGGDPAVVGRTVLLNGHPYEIVGVAPDGVDFPVPADLWAPISHEPPILVRGARFFHVLGRRGPGVDHETAAAQVAGFNDWLRVEFEGRSFGDRELVLQPLHEVVVGSVEPTLLALLGAVVLVLLLTCANLASFALSRAGSRLREFAVRAALGGSRWRLARQALVESCLLSLAGGAAGLLLAGAALRLFVARPPVSLPRLDEVGLDPATFLVALAASLLSGTLFGLLPALAASRPGIASGAAGRGASAPLRRRWLGSGLVAIQVGLALVLLAGSGLLIRSYLAVQAVDTGFRAEDTLTLAITLPDAFYEDTDARTAFWQSLLERLEGLEGVQAAGTSNYLPLADATAVGLFLTPGDRPEAEGPRTAATFHVASPGFFPALGLSLRAGRFPDAGDVAGGEPVLLLNDATVDALGLGEAARAGGADPYAAAVGRLVRVGSDDLRRVVGVVRPIRHWGLESEAEPAVFAPYGQETWTQRYVTIRAADPTRRVAAVREQVRALDPRLPVYDVATMEERLADSQSRRHLTMWLLAAFATAALFQAVLGTWGAAAGWATRRTREIGVRMALGARAADIRRQFLAAGLRLALAGIAAGLATTAALTRFLASLLFGVTPLDPVTLGAGTIGLLVATAVAVLPAARRAASLDPVEALRSE